MFIFFIAICFES